MTDNERCWFGFPLQVKLDKIIEEAWEVVGAIDKEDLENLHEEVADLEHLLDQVKAAYQLDGAVITRIKMEKRIRTLGLISNRGDEDDDPKL